MAKRFLKKDDEVVVSHVRFIVDERQMFVNPIIGDSDIWHDGLQVHRDDDEQLYVEDE